MGGRDGSTYLKQRPQVWATAAPSDGAEEGPTEPQKTSCQCRQLHTKVLALHRGPPQEGLLRQTHLDKPPVEEVRRLEVVLAVGVGHAQPRPRAERDGPRLPWKERGKKGEDAVLGINQKTESPGASEATYF